MPICWKWQRSLNPYRSQMPVRAGELYEPAKKPGGFLRVIFHTLSSRYPIKKANDECQILLEKWAEPLAALSELRGFSVQKAYLNTAYEYLLKNHAHDSICGCSIDQVHKDMEYRFDQCRMIASETVRRIMNNEILQRGTVGPGTTNSLLIWNPLPYALQEVVTLNIDFTGNYPYRYDNQEGFLYQAKNSFKIIDSQENEVEYELVSIQKDEHIQQETPVLKLADRYRITMEANVPPMGTAVYKIVPSESAVRYFQRLPGNEREAENAYIKLTIHENGSITIYDKQSKVSYNKLLGYLDDGEIGDGWNHANPVEDSLIGSFGMSCRIERKEHGSSRTVFKITHYLQVPESMEGESQRLRRSSRNVTMEICSWIGLSKDSREVDVETVINNTARDHRLKLVIPTGIRSDTYFVNQAFAFITRKTGIQLETYNWKEPDCLEKQMGGIVGKRALNGTGIAFISAYGLHECAAPDDEAGAIWVTLFRAFGKTVAPMVKKADKFRES